MKIFITLLVSLFCCFSSFSQVSKLYQTVKGKITDDQKNAAFYYLVKKVNDTTYAANKFNLSGKIVFKGYFKDESLKIPNGEFSFYASSEFWNLSTEVKTIDTNRFVYITGWFLDGQKNGRWINYDNRGWKRRLCTYRNNKLNGLYQIYNLNVQQVAEEGNFVDGKKEGNVDIYYIDDVRPDRTDVYLHNNMVREILHNKSPKAAEEFDQYLEKATAPFFDYLKIENIVVRLSVNENGKVDSILSYSKPINQDVGVVANRALLNSPKFEPGIKGDMPNRQVYIYNFSMGSSYYRKSGPYQVKTPAVFGGDHFEDIGYSLKNIGFGN